MSLLAAVQYLLALTPAATHVTALCFNCCMYVCVVFVQELRHKAEMHRLLRTISHEIRNPLQGILSNTQALISLTTTADQRQALHLLNDSTDDATTGSSTGSSSVSRASERDVERVAAATGLSCNGSRLSNSVLKDNLEGACMHAYTTTAVLLVLYAFCTE
jgi:His Kinase A (phospho-acceptor) domain